MSHFNCKCGEVISDTADNLDYKYYVLPDTKLDEVSTSFTDLIDSFVQAIERGKREEWINQHFGKGYPNGVEASGMLHDLLSSKLVNVIKEMFICQNCGRLLLEKENFQSFLPEKL
ncbi:MAG: hypothetical protein EP332_05610 [Bacteroidetes bacterium]|nr:MAG: hypothetical protein EP332_05610 [Bacteroidota bacterium]